MIYKTKFLYREENVQESLFIDVDGQILNVFSNDYYYGFVPHGEYRVELEFNIFDEYQVGESSLPPQVRKLDHSFAYEIVGVLENGNLSVGNFSIYDEILLRDYGYLEGKNIIFKVDRIDMSIDW
ncbi:hypothetical protein ACDW34_10945 [Acinetobacter piscicola]|uniref:hypothetical protein n=1 Tax=Acinetobacter piscicola TaxID=2006115 RepID=UPI003555EE5D